MEAEDDLRWYRGEVTKVNDTAGMDHREGLKGVQYPLQQMVNHFALECKKLSEKLYHFLNLPFLKKRAGV